jgi:acetyltransferase AlgX (SGNH hydrolase-like protein)
MDMEMSMRRWSRTKTLLVWSGGLLAACLVTSWLLYGVWGPSVLEFLYRSESRWVVERIMHNRHSTPLEAYQQGADRVMVYATCWTIGGYAVFALLLANPLGAVLIGSSCLVTFSVFFLALEWFPALVETLPVEVIDYYAYRKNYVADATLIYREKPLLNRRLANFRGSRYSPVYNIDVEPTTVEWRTDHDGFRNSRTTEVADLIIVGDSWVEYGDHEADTFGKRLEGHLAGLTVTTLGKAGYGPHQYLEVFKRYGLSKKPKYALFCFFEGNDLEDMQDYTAWTNGSRHGFYGNVYAALTESLPTRYLMALHGTLEYMMQTMQLLSDLAISELWQQRGLIHPDIAMVNIGNQRYPTILAFKVKNQKSVDALWESDQINELRDILSDFKALAEQHQIIPIIVYFPVMTHIYAAYSTPDSGTRWNRLREKYISVNDNIETVVVRLTTALDLALINLTPVFADATQAGRILYYALDSHWNADGREIAAAFVAKQLRDKFMAHASGAITK